METQEADELARNWHHPLSKGSSLLHNVLGSMEEFKLKQSDVPLIIKLVENPNYKFSNIFSAEETLNSPGFSIKIFRTILF